MQKLHVFLKNSEVKKNSKQLTRELHWFSFPSLSSQFSKHASPIPPIWTLWAALIRSVRRSGWFSLLQQPPSVLEGVMERTHPPWQSSSTPLAPPGLSQLPIHGALYSCSVLPLPAPVWAHKTWVMGMSSGCAAPHSEFTIPLGALCWSGGEGRDNWVRTGWTEEGRNQVLISFYVY